MFRKIICILLVFSMVFSLGGLQKDQKREYTNKRYGCVFPREGSTKTEGKIFT